MWFGKTSARRMAIREDVAEAESQVRPPPQRMGSVFLMATLFFIVATAIMYYPGESIPYHVGERAPFDLRSRIDFTISDPIRTEEARKAARAATPAVLVANQQAFDRIQSQLLDLRQDVSNVHSLRDIPAETKDRWPNLTPEALVWLKEVDKSAYELKVRMLLTQVLPEVPTVDQGTLNAIEGRQSDRVHLADSGSLEGSMRDVPRSNIVPLGAAPEAQGTVLHRAVGEAFPQAMVGQIVGYLIKLGVPTYRLDGVLTAQLEERNVKRVQLQGREVLQTTPIVRYNEVIDPDAHKLLVEAQREYENVFSQRQPWAWLLAKLGQALTVLVLTLAGTLYVTRMNPSLNSPSRAWTLMGLLISTLAVAKLAVTFWPNAQYMLGIAPTMLAAAILIMAYNQRFALGISALHGLLVTLALNQNFDFFLTLLTGVAFLAFALKEVRTLGTLIRVGVFAGAALFACVWAIGLARYLSLAWNIALTPASDLDTIAFNSLWAASAGIAVGFIALGLLPTIERMFKITTAMTLLGLCDANRPLLRRMAAEAPGTFNHSLIVGTMTEAAAHAIGANGLLCRVGAYYHDVGKLSKPQYFIENQAGGPNRHDKLSPAMSLLIIVGHVKDGIELAREYGLPWVVREFIAQHHGTTLVEYFFNVARERQMKESAFKGEATPVSETEFRYPGPKPQTRETAILMVCDAVESITRSMPDHTPGRLETVVHQMVTKRLMDGQFSECDLTLKDLAIIEQSMVRTLAGVYHGRVSYPKATAAAQRA
jgi:putative nucleotidyltransferase with HDIG domain